MKKLEPIFTQEKPPGLYRFGSRAKTESILAAVEKHGWHGFYIDGQEISDKPTFISQFATALSFPDYHGKNWDAFEDCVTDMAWAPAQGYVLLYDHVRHFANGNSKEWQMACNILQEAARYWQSKDRPMYVLLRRYWWTAWDIEKL